MDNVNPKVFISHATEDKDSFVISFAKRLRENGIDAWVDKWEMLPGDSLINKIFDEGIKNAVAFIIILSKNSVNKPWVKEELNAGLLKRIEGKCKVIPVVIEDCEIPEVLKTTIWEKIKDKNNYDEEFGRILASIFGVLQKPILGTPPKFVTSTIIPLTGFSKIDMLVLKTIGDLASSSDSPIFGPELVKESLFEFGITDSQINESLTLLNEQNFIDTQIAGMNNEIAFFRVTTYGYANYAKIYYPKFQELLENSLVAIVNENIFTNDELSKYLGISKPVINRILDILSSQGYFELIKTYGGEVSLYNISTLAKRIAST